MEVSLVHDKSDKHLTVYDSYNSETAAKLIKTIEFANIGNDLRKHLLYKQFLVWNTNGCSTAPLGDFTNNLVVQKLKKETKYFASDSDKRLYIDLRQAQGYTKGLEKPKRNDAKMTFIIETKNALAHKMRLRVWGYTNGEYIYLLNDKSVTLKNKTYTLKSQYKELES